MPSAIRFRCPYCQARMRAPWELRGQMRDCPRCQRPLIVKMEPPEDAEPILLRDEPSAPSRSTATF
jgi:hypothetical protein